MFRLCVVLPFLAHAAMAQTNTPAPSSRRYDSRIKMHTTPITLVVPDDSLETRKGAPEPSERDLMIPSTIPLESQIRPNGPRLRTPQDKQQNKNWIPSSSTEPDTKDTKDEETTLGRQEEPVPSGWGWLADDVRARQQKQQKEDDQKDGDSKKEEPDLLQQPTGKKEDVKPKTDGIFLDTAFKPVSSSTATKENEEKGDESTSARDESQEEQKTRTDGPTTVESPLKRTAADQPREQKFGADATWGNESLWNKNSKPVSTLPQTESLLSMSKRDAKNPIAGLDRPGVKPDAAGSAADRIEPNRPEPPRRDFVTAASFQPLPAAPVNELGSSSWDGGLPGKTPFGESTPFSPEPGITPSRPIESLTAPELPKPVATPWLK